MSRLGKYELLNRIAAGGQAETFRARAEGAAGVTKQVVIKKVLPSFAEDEEYIAAFISEAKLSSGLSHGNIAQVFEFGEDGGAYFLAMEWVDGKSLGEALRRAAELGQTRMPVPLALFLAIEVCKALHYAHGKGIVHRDVSPDNVLIGFEGQTKVIDFGIAKAVLTGRRETEPGLVKGKFQYFSPEQANAEPVDGRSDVFALGIVLYRMLTGVMPFIGQMHEVVHLIRHARFTHVGEANPNLSPMVTTAVMKAMAEKPADRWATAHELQQALSTALYAEDRTVTSETVKDWMTWLFTGQKSERLTQQLAAWTPAPSVKATAPERTTSVVPVENEKGSPLPYVYAGVAAAAIALVALVYWDVLREAPTPPPPGPPSASGPPVKKVEPVRDALVFPGSAVVRADRHHLDLAGATLPKVDGALTQVVEKNASSEDSPLFVHLPSGLTVLALQTPVPLPEGTASARVFDFRPFATLPRGATRTLDFGAGQTLSFKDDLAAVGARAGKWMTVEGVPAQTKVRLTLRALDPDRWVGRPRAASVLVVWKRAFGRLPPPPGGPWPDELDRAVLTPAAPLFLEHATEVAMAFVDPLASDEKDSVMVELFDTGEPASRPDPAALAKIAQAHLAAAPAAPAGKKRGTGKTIQLSGADSLFDEALTAFERGRYSEARPKLEQCIAVAPRDFGCHKLLGSVLTALGDTRRGAAAYREYVKLAPPGDPDVPKVRALIQLAEGQSP